MTDYSVLDNPMWHSLTSGHREMALRHGRAARFPAEVSPIAAIEDGSAEALADLRELVPTGGLVALLRDGPCEVAKGWELKLAITIDQMVCHQLAPAVEIPLVALGEGDAPEMLALARLTQPGPFEAQTYRMGRYRGVRAEDGRLVAMAGERSRPPGLTEVSAVCTAPEFRGKGLAKVLVSGVSRLIEADGRTPFLHLASDNIAAKAVYERLGFRFRRLIHVTALAAV